LIRIQERTAKNPSDPSAAAGLLVQVADKPATPEPVAALQETAVEKLPPANPDRLHQQSDGLQGATVGITSDSKIQGRH